MLQSYISQQFNGTIWRLEIDELSETIFVETRNEQDKQVSFSSINLNTGHTNFKELTTPERWLTGIEAAYNGVLLLHNYQSENGPLHKGIIAIDAISGETLWGNYINAFDHLSADGPVVYNTNIQPKKLFLADVKTGATNRAYDPSVNHEIQNSIVVPQLIDPAFLSPELILFSPFGNSIHYLEYNNFRIVSLHTLEAETLKQYLYIFNGVDKVYDDLLNTSIQKLQPEAFILHKTRLIYIKDKSVLNIVNL
ncbi:DUF4905 domain-containing protein [Mucilaginibacter sp. X5P1]|uniref:DUF4905 domain-containing protein n=1 Tax=Mucilaginibacter sp. X5P1 TaxID=2723088 RepID=UPI001618D5D5|nr:DUF4905 domain-containing protein [Mucilaginibacter sp. X5P1]MBB6137479.1 hypothetical protein [Mucilaginibacter sp. X5P1]